MRNSEQTTTWPEDSTAAWFLMLEVARRKNDFEGAARATRELERLGVKIKYIQPGKTPKPRWREVVAASM